MRSSTRSYSNNLSWSTDDVRVYWNRVRGLRWFTLSSMIYNPIPLFNNSTVNLGIVQDLIEGTVPCSDCIYKIPMKRRCFLGGRRKQLDDCCDPGHLFSMTKVNTPVGENLWFDGEFLYSLIIDNATYSLFPQDTPFKLPLKRCSVVGNGGILKGSRCGKQIDEADFVIRCNLPPLTSDYSLDVGTKTQLVTVNPSIIDQRFQNLLWSRKSFVESLKVYKSSYVYMPAFSMRHGTEPSLRAHYTLTDFSANQTVLFANPNFLRNVGKFWKNKGIHSKRLSTGLFMVSAALSLCEEVSVYGFWPFQIDLKWNPIRHHYYDDVPPLSGFHSMPEEFLQLWLLHKSGILRMQLGQCNSEEPQ